MFPTKTLWDIKYDRFIHRRKPPWVRRCESNRWKRRHRLFMQFTPARKLAIKELSRESRGK